MNTAAGEPRVVVDGAVDQVVVGVDGSSNASDAAHWAASEAGKRGARLVIAHAVQPPHGPSAPRESLEHADHRRAQGRVLLERELERVVSGFPELPVHTVLHESSPANALTSLSREAALVVMGTRGYGGFTGMLVGSVTRKLAAYTHCPLTVLGSQPREESRGEMVLGIGPTPAPGALRFAFEAARRDHLGILGVQAWWPNPRFEGMLVPGSISLNELDVLREAALTDAEAAVKPLEAEFPEVRVRLEIRGGNAVPELLQAARNARLLVVGAHRHRGPFAVGAGYVVDGVLGRSPAPVVIVPEA